MLSVEVSELLIIDYFVHTQTLPDSSDSSGTANPESEENLLPDWASVLAEKARLEGSFDDAVNTCNKAKLYVQHKVQ